MTITSNNSRVWLALATSVSLLAAAARSADAADPGTRGPHNVVEAEYDLGDQAFQPSDFPVRVEIRASVRAPKDLTSGPFPVIVLVHGRHTTCFDPSDPSGADNDGSFLGGFLEWPCSAGRESIPSFRGYDYLADLLASHGMVVVSISTNGINAHDNDTDDAGMLARAELIQKHLELLRDDNPLTGELGPAFASALDFDRVGTLGHSRGGEGVVRHFLLNREQGQPFGVRAVMPLASTNFHRFVASGVPLAVSVAYCDGDVTDLQGLHYFDDARYADLADTAPKYSILTMGANHNFYNTIWSPSTFVASAGDDFADFFGDDSECSSDSPTSGRLDEPTQQATLVAYASAFFRTHVAGETEFAGLLTGADAPPPSAKSKRIFAGIHPAAGARRDVNRLDRAGNLQKNTLGDTAAPEALQPYAMCGRVPTAGGSNSSTSCLDSGSDEQEPHATGAGQLRIGYETGSAYRNQLPAGSRDVRAFNALQFRAAVDFEDPSTADGPPDFTIRLTDVSGASAIARVSKFSRSLFVPPGSADGLLPKLILNAVRIPTSAFVGVDLSNVKEIRFEFDRPGALVVSDLMFSR